MNLLPSSPTLFLFSSFCTFQSNIPLTFYYNRSSHSTLLPLLLIHIFVCNHTHARALFLPSSMQEHRFLLFLEESSLHLPIILLLLLLLAKNIRKNQYNNHGGDPHRTHTLLPPSHRQIDMHKLFLPMSSSSSSFWWWWWFLLPYQPPTWILRAYEPTADCLHSSHILEPATTVETRPGNQSNRRSIVHRKVSTFAPTQLLKHARWLPRRRRQLTQTVRI